jgi:hypothetical protein
MNHRVYAAGDLSLPLKDWTECTQLSYVDEGNDIRLIEIAAPTPPPDGGVFLRVVK